MIALLIFSRLLSPPIASFMYSSSFPPHFQFGFEIDNSTKLIPYLLEFDGISFIPESLAAPYLQNGKLQSIELLDFDAPKINCYKIQRI